MKRSIDIESPAPVLPSRGLCAHRGVMEQLPENSLASLREAVRLGAHMIEFDLRICGDGELVVFHDKDVQRMTGGEGRLIDMTVAQLQKLRLRCPQTGQLTDERIPTLIEALEMLPRNVWLNLHIKDRAEKTSRWQNLVRRFFRTPVPESPSLTTGLTRLLTREGRIHQSILACSGNHARAARKENPEVKLCSLLRGSNAAKAVREAINSGAQFIQMSDKRSPTPGMLRELKKHGIRITYGFADSAEKLEKLFADGIDFPLVNNLHELAPRAAALGLDPVGS